MGRLGIRRWEGIEDSHRFDVPEPSRIHLPDGPPASRRRHERDIADAAPPARVHRRPAIDLRQALEPCS